MRILGIDPGSRFTGFGCIEVKGNQVSHVASGTLSLAGGRASVDFDQRLLKLFEELDAIIAEHSPQVMVVEKIFFAKNALSALKLGHARGVVLVSGARHALTLAEYSPTEVKQAVTGHGRADKDQVRKMVELVCGRRNFPSNDASDALALAICHARSSLTNSSSEALQAWAAASKRSKKRSKSLSELLAPVIRAQRDRDC